MKCFLLIIELPEGKDENYQANKEPEWMQLLKTLSSSEERVQNIELIPPNVWMIPSNNGLPFLRNALCLAKEGEFHCRVLALDEAPDWLV
jgi:hypothetical protein